MIILFECYRRILDRFSTSDANEEHDYEIFGTNELVTTSLANMIPSAGLRRALNSVVIEVDIDGLMARMKFVGCSGYMRIFYINDITCTDHSIRTIIRNETLPFRFLLVSGVESQLVQHEFRIIREVLMGEGRKRGRRELRTELRGVMENERECDAWEPFRKWTMSYKKDNDAFSTFGPPRLRELAVLCLCTKYPCGVPPASYS